MIMTLYNNYNANGGVADNNNDSNNNSDNIEYTTVAEMANSALPSCSSMNVMAKGSLRWKTNVISDDTTSSAVTLPKRDFHFKRIEVEEAPKWFVWPKRNKKNKSSRNEKMTDGKLLNSSNNRNIISRPDILLSKSSPMSVSAMPQNISDLANANNNLQQNFVEQHNTSTMILVQPERDNAIKVQSASQKYRRYEMHCHSMDDAATGTKLINISNSEQNSYIMRCRITARVDSEHRISGSGSTTSQTFKILSISKKSLESGDDDELDLSNSVISNFQQSHSTDSIFMSTNKI